MLRGARAEESALALESFPDLDAAPPPWTVSRPPLAAYRLLGLDDGLAEDEGVAAAPTPLAALERRRGSGNAAAPAPADDDASASARRISDAMDRERATQHRRAKYLGATDDDARDYALRGMGARAADRPATSAPDRGAAEPRPTAGEVTPPAAPAAADAPADDVAALLARMRLIVDAVAPGALDAPMDDPLDDPPPPPAG